MGAETLKASMAQYQAMSGGNGKMAGIVEADKGFEMKAGYNHGACGPALPISKGPSDSYMQEPSAGDLADDDAADVSKVVEPSGGFKA